MTGEVAGAREQVMKACEGLMSYDQGEVLVLLHRWLSPPVSTTAPNWPFGYSGVTLNWRELTYLERERSAGSQRGRRPRAAVVTLPLGMHVNEKSGTEDASNFVHSHNNNNKKRTKLQHGNSKVISPRHEDTVDARSANLAKASAEARSQVHNF